MPKLLSEETRRVRKEVRDSLYRESNKNEQAIRARKWYEKNRDAVKEKSKRYYITNKRKKLSKSKEYRENNKEKLSSYNSEYCKNNRDLCSMKSSRRRAIKAGNGGSHTVDQRKNKFQELGNICYYCGIPGKMTVDHLTPISRGGTDDIGNIVPACLRCNCSKRDRTAKEFFESMTDIDISINLAAVADYKATH